MKRILLLLALACGICGAALGQIPTQATLDTIGMTALGTAGLTLTGSGIDVAQIEAVNTGGDFEVDPGAPGQPVSLFTWRSAAGISGTFPNRVGIESQHANEVAEIFYGENTGISPRVKHVNNYESDFFYTNILSPQEVVNARLFNQSFEFSLHNATEDQRYDDYIAEYHQVVVSGVGDGGAVDSPSDCYNGIGVAAYGGQTSVGPSVDGRCKPDITAPADVTSYSTPLVSGAAALLMQEGRRLGVNSMAAIDCRTVKALLLNGAVKPPGWTHSSMVPLDLNSGAGILNVYNSYLELTAGRYRPMVAAMSREHPVLPKLPAVPAPLGWDYRVIGSTPAEMGVNHYRITTSGTGNLISTLVWNKEVRKTAINRLGLYVYDGNGTLLASSSSTVDNVQHVSVSGLTAGTYEVQVVKMAGAPGVMAGVVTGEEAYALVWDFER